MAAPATLPNSHHGSSPVGAASFLASYLFLGLLHELSHIAIASVLLPSFRQLLSLDDIVHDIRQFVTRALLGRYCLIEIEVDGSSDVAAGSAAMMIRHFGWIFSVALAIGLHYCFWRSSKETSKKSSIFQPSSIFVVAAYVTAFEAVTTDMLGWIPLLGQVRHSIL